MAPDGSHSSRPASMNPTRWHKPVGWEIPPVAGPPSDRPIHARDHSRRLVIVTHHERHSGRHVDARRRALERMQTPVVGPAAVHRQRLAVVACRDVHALHQNGDATDERVALLQSERIAVVQAGDGRIVTPTRHRVAGAGPGTEVRGRDAVAVHRAD